MDYDDYEEHRVLLDTLRRDQRSTFDKEVLRLSTAALGFSVALLSFFYQNFEGLNFRALIFSWAFFVTAISLNLFSYNSAEFALQREIDDLDQEMLGSSERKSAKNLHLVTHIVNVIVSVPFILGAISMLVFAYSNAEAGKFRERAPGKSD
jgi:hypothetical protein